MENVTEEPAANPHDLVVLSDLHLGEGLRHNEPRYSPTEDFFCDHSLVNFLNALAAKYKTDPSRLKLVLNGDVFDFLTVTSVPGRSEAQQRGFTVSPAEEKFGLNPTAKKSVFKLDVIASGHMPVFAALARFIAAGHRLEILRGNHDLELFFESVRKHLMEILAGATKDLSFETVSQRVRFHDWFYIEPGRVYIEHGNQYDSTNSIRYTLHPVLSKRRWWASEKDDVLDYPIGSIFVRFFYNRVRRLDPYTPRLLSFDHYFRFIRRYNLFDVWRVYRDHYPHFVAALGPATTVGSAGPSQAEDKKQEDAFDKAANHAEFGDLYRPLNRLKISPDSASKTHVVGEMISAFIRHGFRLGLFAFAILFLWFGLFQLIDSIPWLTANAFVMSVFVVLTLSGALWTWIHLDRKLKHQRSTADVANLVERAEKIAELTHTKMVLMGHTHLVDYRSIGSDGAVYANSGTWTSVDNPWNRIMRDARRMTFLYVKNDRVELARWNDDAGRIDNVPLFYLEDDSLPTPSASTAGLDLERQSCEHSWLPSAMVPDDDDDLNDDHL
jgi:UDP-2,3-diacylglucosamine pyrophosphatase LpxH